MDIALCVFNRSTGRLQYAGAYNPLGSSATESSLKPKPIKFPIGNSKSGDTNRFTNHEIQLEKGDTLLYLLRWLF